MFPFQRLPNKPEGKALGQSVIVPANSNHSVLVFKVLVGNVLGKVFFECDA